MFPDWMCTAAVATIPLLRHFLLLLTLQLPPSTYTTHVATRSAVVVVNIIIDVAVFDI